MMPLASRYSYWAPTIVRASCGSASHVFHRESPGVDDPDGIVRAGGPTSDGMFQRMTPAFGCGGSRQMLAARRLGSAEPRIVKRR